MRNATERKTAYRELSDVELDGVAGGKGHDLFRNSVIARLGNQVIGDLQAKIAVGALAKNP